METARPGQSAPAALGGDTGYTELNVNLNEQAAVALRDYVERHGISYTEAIRRAIAVLKFVDDQISAGRDMQVIDGEAVRRIVLVR